MTIALPVKLYRTQPAIPHWWGWRLLCRTWRITRLYDRIVVEPGGYADYPIRWRRLHG